MTTPQIYDAIIVGSGQGGNPLAGALANAGMRAALIERKHVGGTCINEGCTPTKTMIASARVAYLARRGADYGVTAGPISIDMTKVRERKRKVVDSFRNGSQKTLETTANLDLIFGEASFSGPKRVMVRLRDGGQTELSGARVFINAGTRASVPRIDGLDGVPFLDNTSMMELDVVPEHLLVLGGGYIGVEFGQMFRRFGSRVTVINRAGHLLNGEDTDVAEAVADILRQDGIEIVLNAQATRVSGAPGNIRVTVESDGGSSEMAGSHLLVATGRTPNSDSLNLVAAGVETDARGYIKVNERLETSAEGVYALGDIKGGPAFTHISYDDFRILRAKLIDKKSASTKGRFVPYTLFMDPQLGRVGITEDQARAQGRKVRVAKLAMTSVARAIETDEARGFMKAIVDADSGQILGAAVLGVEGGEIMSAIEIAMMGKLPYTALRDGTFAHPTLVESLNNLFMAMDSKK
jgi:pyruvate/2-oxoglutarate dehydrogenase complex dihydrolipoamide dehydrogenase (E3) component